MFEGEKLPCRIYAPVGHHADLLAYLVRRLLENGANSSFVNNILDDSIPMEYLLEDPLAALQGQLEKRNARIALPAELYEHADADNRVNSCGLDLSDA